ncbi:MAG: Do family serine endopeptidase [Deltaproteobacteria bacterium]|nr:Do family serine endopeptidase [Deltaproteobacteria bacterium]MBW2595318.1 Do family serine endopeptidase [Deltaproteobacteria bacterium]MBW2649984.1 Do family serine endopeptidase [Deltaproteobacteria bacterium]
MKSFRKIVIAIAIIFSAGIIAGVATQLSAASQDTGSYLAPANFSALAEQVKGGVVNIRVEKVVKENEEISHFSRGNPFRGKTPFEDFFGPFPRGDNRPAPKQRGLGSGFIIDRSGYIVTNNHVIEGADTIIVTLSNKKEYEAELIGRDPKTDMALLRIEHSKGLTPLALGDSDALTVGEWVVAIGSPFGLEQTVTAGIVSAKGRVIGAGPYDDFIQTDASINPGNSGGPLINMKGEVIGINTAIVARGQGIGFAIPINLAQGIVEQLKNNGEVTRAWLGVGIQDLTEELGDYYNIKDKKGVLVTEVFENSPADKGGIKAEDVIVSIDGEDIDSGRKLSGIVANLPVGKRTRITIQRNGERKDLSVELAKRTDEEMVAKKPMKESDNLGIKAADITPEIADRLGYGGDMKGVVVLEVKKGSKAEKSGVRQGDLVVAVNHVKVKTVDDYLKEVNRVDEGKKVKLLLRRGRAGFIALAITK